jgi:hypothetical protein
MLAEPTSTQREAFALLGTSIPLNLTCQNAARPTQQEQKVRPGTACRTGRNLGLYRAAD